MPSHDRYEVCSGVKNCKKNPLVDLEGVTHWVECARHDFCTLDLFFIINSILIVEIEHSPLWGQHV